MVYTIVSAVMFALMIGFVAFLFIKGFVAPGKSREKRIKFLKNYKKGRFFIIYFLAYPLFLICFLSTGMAPFDAVLRSITNILNLVVMKYDMAIPLAETNVMFAIAIYTAYVLAFLNAILFAASCLGQIVWDWMKNHRFRRCKVDKTIIIGNNETSISVYNTCKNKKLLVDILTKEETDNLFIDKIAYKACSTDEKLFLWCEKTLEFFSKKLRKNKLSIIINTNDEQKNLRICSRFVQYIEKVDKKSLPYINIYVYGDKDYEDIYTQYEIKTNGCLHYINKYKQVAIDFVDQYPLTKYLTKKQINYSTSLLDKDANINVVMVGFGKTNQQLFLTMVPCNQFISKDAHGKLVNHQVEYHFLDKKNPESEKNLNHCYYRYKHNFFDKKIKNKNNYLPLIDLPAHETFHDVDVNSIEFYDVLKKALAKTDKSLNYIIISMGKDHDNIDYATKIFTKVAEWKLNNTHIFVRIKDTNTADDSKQFLDNKTCHIFGKIDSAFSYESIVREHFTNMAIVQDLIYTNEAYNKSYKDVQKIVEDKRNNWNRKSGSDRESSTFACLSLKSKLQMMGLDYVSKDDKDSGRGLSEKEYLNIYARNDMPEFVDDGKSRQVVYTLDFKKSRRGDMAWLEHNRWSAFMITKGFVPCTKQHIATHSNKKDKVGDNLIRVHKCITTMDGLVELRKILANANNTSEANEDVIKYDYQILDNAYALLKNNNFKIIKKVN